MKLRFLILIPMLLVGCATPHPAESKLAETDRNALETGQAILTADGALQYESKLPDNPSPSQIAQSEKLTHAMVQAGQLTSLYPWIRARISSEISVTEHLLNDTRPEEARTRQLNRRLKYLQHTLLLIDAPL